MKICLSCGVLVPADKTNCPKCSGALRGNTAEIDSLPADLCVCRLGGHVVCSGCNAEIEIGGIDDASELRCKMCGHSETVDDRDWKDILTHAHNTADFGGIHRPSGDDQAWSIVKDKEGSFTRDSYRSMGCNKTSLPIHRGAGCHTRYNVEVCPGNPVCRQCSTPYELQTDSGQVLITCSNCKTKTRCNPPDRFGFYKPFVGYIPPAPPRPAQPTSWWAIFKGPSTIRKEVEDEQKHQKEVEQTQRTERLSQMVMDEQQLAREKTSHKNVVVWIGLLILAWLLYAFLIN